MSDRRILLIALVCTIGLAGCKTTERYALPTVLEISQTDCAAEPSLDNSIELQFSETETLMNRSFLNDLSGCLVAADGERTLYQAFSLPKETAPYRIGVGSEPYDGVQLAPRLIVLDKTGNVLESRNVEDFHYRGVRLTAVLTPPPEAAYLVVASDPSLIGQNDQSMTSEANTTVAATPYGAFTMYSATEALAQYVYAHSGLIVVDVSPVRRVE